MEGDDANDLPMQNYQYDFNCRLQTESLIDTARFKVPELDKRVQGMYDKWAEDEALWTELVIDRDGLTPKFDMKSGAWRVPTLTLTLTLTLSLIITLILIRCMACPWEY